MDFSGSKYKSLCLVFFIFTTLWTNVGALEIEHDSNGRIILKTDKCEELKTHVESIIQWTKSRGELVSHPKIDCEINPNLAQYDISELIPSSVKKIYGKKPQCHGPNCFNAALIDNNLFEHQMYVDDLYLNRVLESDCTKRIYSDSFKPGDLAVMSKIDSSGHYQVLHAFTIVDDTLACSKDGMGVLSACVLQPLGRVYSTYGLRDLSDQKNCINPTEVLASKCNVVVYFFACKNKSQDEFNDQMKNFLSRVGHCTMTGGLHDISTLKKEFEEIQKVDDFLRKSIEVQLSELDDVAWRLEGKKNALVKRIKGNDLAGVRALAEIIIKEYGQGSYFLREAIRESHTEIAKFLIGVPGVVADDECLQLAVKNGNTEIVKLLQTQTSTPSK